MSPDRVWRVIGGFGSLPDWSSSIRESAPGDGGRVRHLTSQDGVTLVERLMAFDDAGRSYSYGVVASLCPQTAYVSTLRVCALEAGTRCRVDWFGGFTPAGASDAEVSQLFQAIHDQGLQSLAGHFEVLA